MAYLMRTPLTWLAAVTCLITLFCAAPLVAQQTPEDRYEFYFTRVDDQPASILVNLSLHDTAPLRTHPYFTFLSVKFLSPTQQGLASNADHTNLTGLVELIEHLAPDAQLFAGRKMGAGANDYFFYTKTKGAIDATIKQAMADYGGYAYQIGSRDDPNWEVYSGFLYPTPYDFNFIRNTRVREALFQAGDDLSKARSIDHFVIFTSAAKVGSFVTKAQRLGFRAKTPSLDTETNTTSVQIIREDSPNDIDNLTFDLGTLAAEFGGTYDGWASIVVK